MTDILIEADKLATFLKLDKAWRSQLSQDGLALPSEYELVWLSRSTLPETVAELDITPKVPVRVRHEFVDFLRERGFAYEVIESG